MDSYFRKLFGIESSTENVADAHLVVEMLVTFVRVIQDDPNLLGWFYGIEKKTEIQRANEIRMLAMKMAAEQFDHKLVASLKLMTDPRIFKAMLMALRRDNEPLRKG